MPPRIYRIFHSGHGHHANAALMIPARNMEEKETDVENDGFCWPHLYPRKGMRRKGGEAKLFIRYTRTISREMKKKEEL
jgi:hypothetical protein